MAKEFKQAPITEEEKEELLVLINTHPNQACIEWYRKGAKEPILLIGHKSKKRDIIHYDAVGEAVGSSFNKINLVFASIKKYGSQLKVSVPSTGHQYVAKQFDTSKKAAHEKYERELTNLRKVE